MVDDRDTTERRPTAHATDTGSAPTLAITAEGHAPTVAISAGDAPTVAASPESRSSAAALPPPPSVSLSTTRPLSARTRRESAPPTAGARYTLGSRIGEGGMGEVLVAFDEQIGREVAVKRTLAAHPSGDELSRFLREARVQGRLEHPAVVPVHDLGIDEAGRPFFVMKRLMGEAMSEMLRRMRAGEVPDVIGMRRRLLRAFVDVCFAIELAHSRNVVHRDLKPANIMLGDFGEVYVLDWGVARILTDHEATTGPIDLGLDSGATHAGTVLGTPAYMAPEQLAGDAATPAADIYALGCVLYEIVANEPLHVRARSLEGIVKTIDARPSTRRADAPPELDSVCERATELDPGARYVSARALGDAVQAFLDGDRDLAVRRDLALLHLSRAREATERARAAYTAGPTESHRSVAMREAGRALALDPESADAAMLVTQLMLEPPVRTPPAVETRLAELDTNAAQLQGRLAAFAMIGYLGFIPFLLWTGVRDLTIVIAFAALAVAGGVQVFALARSTVIRAEGIYLNAVINALLIAFVSRIVGPFLIAPTLVATTLMGYAVHPKLGRIRIVAIILAAGVAVPWLLEVAGVLESTYSFDHGALVIASPTITFTALPVQLAFVALLVSLITIVALLSRTLAMRQRDVTRRIELQAWQLRQLVPTRQ